MGNEDESLLIEWIEPVGGFTFASQFRSDINCKA